MNTTYLNKDSMAMSFRIGLHIISSIKSKCDIKMFTNQNNNHFSNLSLIEGIMRQLHSKSLVMCLENYEFNFFKVNSD